MEKSLTFAGEPTADTAVVTLSKKIPADGGKLFATIKDERREFVLQIYEKKSGEPTNQVKLRYIGVGSGEPLKNFKFVDIAVGLTGQSVEIQLNEYRPPIPTTTNLLRDIRAELEQIRLQER